MQHEAHLRPSHWFIRAMEWNDGRARYPNLWRDGMPRRLVASERMARRLRLGDLVACFYPASQRYPERSERCVGLSRVVGLHRDESGATSAWVDLETAHRFREPLKLERLPRRVLLCCDAGWPDEDVALFDSVLRAAIAEGWTPAADENTGDTANAANAPDPDSETVGARSPGPRLDESSGAAPTEEMGAVEPPAEVPTTARAVTSSTSGSNAARILARGAATGAARVEPSAGAQAERGFAGVDYSGDMRDLREGTWLAILRLHRDRLTASRLEPTGRVGLQSLLRDPDAAMLGVEAFGLDFPFSVPEPFAEELLHGPFPKDGWWGLVKRMEKMTRPGFLSAVHEFRNARGDVPRLTDELSGTASPLSRAGRDLTPMTFHGMRMIGEDRSRFAVRPFETAQACLLLEVRTDPILNSLTGEFSLDRRATRRDVLEQLGRLAALPVTVEGALRRSCLEQPGALRALVAARCAAIAVISGEAERSPDELAPQGQAARVRHEGWIYGLGGSA